MREAVDTTTLVGKTVYRPDLDFGEHLSLAIASRAVTHPARVEDERRARPQEGEEDDDDLVFEGLVLTLGKGPEGKLVLTASAQWQDGYGEREYVGRTLPTRHVEVVRNELGLPGNRRFGPDEFEREVGSLLDLSFGRWA